MKHHNQDDETLRAAIGMIGLPSSGKTAFIYAACISYAECAGWKFSIANPQVRAYVAALGKADGGNRPLWENTPGELPHKSYKLFKARRRGLFSTFIEPSLGVAVPDMPGELIRMASGRGKPPDGNDRQRVDQMMAHLQECSGLICLIDPTQLDSQVAQQVEDMTNIVTQIVHARRHKEPLAVSLALTKLDVILGDRRRSVISLPVDDCLRLAYLNEQERDPTRAGIDLKRRGYATYNLNDSEMYRGPQGTSDPEHDKAVAWDYLNVHLPAAARAARSWNDDGRATVRAYMISSWGGMAPKNANGKEVVPLPNEIKPIRLLEPLRGVLDRVGRDRRNRRLNWWLGLAAAVLLPLMVLGPLSVPIANSYATGRLDKGNTEGADWALRAIDYHPILQLDRARCPGRLADLAATNYRLASIIAAGATRESDYDTAFAAADRALRLAPDADEVSKWRDGLLEKHVRERMAGGDLVGALHLLQVSVGSLGGRPVVLPVIHDAVSEYAKKCRNEVEVVVSPDSASDPAADTSAGPGDTDARLSQVAGSLGQLDDFLKAFSRAETTRSGQAGGVGRKALQIMEAAAESSQASSALLELAHGNIDKAERRGQEAQAHAMHVGGDEGLAVLADAVNVSQRVAAKHLDDSLAALAKAVAGEGPAAAPAAAASPAAPSNAASPASAAPTNAAPANSGNAEAYPQLIAAVKTIVSAQPSLLRRADQELVAMEQPLLNQVYKEASGSAGDPAAVRSALRPLAALAELHPLAGAGDSAVDPAEFGRQVEALLAYRQIDLGLRTGDVESVLALKPADPPQSPVIAVRISSGTWDVSAELAQARRAVRNEFCRFCQNGLTVSRSDVEFDKQLAAAVKLSAALLPAAPSGDAPEDVETVTPMRQATTCLKLYLAVAGNTFKPGESAPTPEMTLARDAAGALFEKPMPEGQLGALKKMLAGASARLLAQGRLEHAFAFRRLLTIRKDDAPDRAAAFAYARADMDQRILDPALFPPATDAQAPDLLRGYLEAIKDDARVEALLVPIVKRLRAAPPMPPAPHLVKVWKDVASLTKSQLPEEVIEPIFAADMKFLNYRLASKGIDPKDVAPFDYDGFIKMFDAYGAPLAAKAAAASQKLEKTVRDNDMVFVRGWGEQAQSNQAKLSYYLARDEMTLGRYVELVKADPTLAYNFLPNPDEKVPAGIDGTGKPFGLDTTRTHDENMDVSAFGIPYDKAEQAAKAAGGRLPTAAEWISAFSDRNWFLPPIELDKDVFNNTQDGKTLADAGDVTSKGVRGMYCGVREWVTSPSGGNGALCGDSWFSHKGSRPLDPPDPRTLTQPGNLPGLLDCGFRLAADAAPVELKQYFDFIKQDPSKSR